MQFGQCCKYLDSVVNSRVFWKWRFERDFGMKFDCDIRIRAKDEYKLMSEIWDKENNCFDLK